MAKIFMICIGHIVLLT